MAKQVQIDDDLFIDLYVYFRENAPHENSPEDELFTRLQEKADRMIDRALFTTYKRAPTPEEREKARQEYLDRRGISKSFRTDTEIHGI